MEQQDDNLFALDRSPELLLGLGFFGFVTTPLLAVLPFLVRPVPELWFFVTFAIGVLEMIVLTVFGFVLSVRRRRRRRGALASLADRYDDSEA